MQKNSQNRSSNPFYEAFSFLEEDEGSPSQSSTESRGSVFPSGSTLSERSSKSEGLGSVQFSSSAASSFASELSEAISNISAESFFQRPAVPKTRCYVFTVSGAVLLSNELDSNFYAGVFSRGNVAYICLGYEYTTEGYSHIQGFIRFVSCKTFKSCVKLLSGPLPSVHCEPARDPAGAISYCKKNGSWEEKGNLPSFSHTKHSLSESGEYDFTKISKSVALKRRLYADLADGARPHDLIKSRPEEHHYIMSISRYATADRVRSCPAQVLFVWGDTGLGKTSTFQAVCGRLNLRYYSKCPGDRWFDGYDGQPIILIDEFSDSSFTCCQWNSFCNPAPPVLEVKGSKLINLSTHYIVLANRGPEEFYQRVKAEVPSLWAAYRRRLTAVHHLRLTPSSSLESLRQDLALVYSTFLSDLL